MMCSSYRHGRPTLIPLCPDIWWQHAPGWVSFCPLSGACTDPAGSVPAEFSSVLPFTFFFPLFPSTLGDLFSWTLRILTLSYFSPFLETSFTLLSNSYEFLSFFYYTLVSKISFFLCVLETVSWSSFLGILSSLFSLTLSFIYFLKCSCFNFL